MSERESATRLPWGLSLGVSALVVVAHLCAPTVADAALAAPPQTQAGQIQAAQTQTDAAAAPFGLGALMAVPGMAEAVSRPLRRLLDHCPKPPATPLTESFGPGKTVTLTFDDGPGVETPLVLDVLRARGVHATFFILGSNAREYPDLVRRIAAEGHVLANHSWDHPMLSRHGAADQAAQIDDTQAEIQALTGRRPCMLRPPYGEYDETTQQLARERGLAIALWSVDTLDWEAPPTTTASAVGRIVSRAMVGGAQQHPVVLFHDGGGSRTNTVAALGRVIDFYAAAGYTFTAAPAYPPADALR